MAREKKRSKKEETDDEEKTEMTVDPYTGEIVPVPEDAGKFIEVVPEETDDRNGSNYLLKEETSLDSYVADADADAVAEQSAHYTDDEDVKEDFAERQELATGGRKELEEDLDEHNSLSPDISGGDIDAAWADGNVAGEETVGGTVPTPDQDRVDDLGAAAGIRYKDDEPLDSDRKILDRDRNRWELNPLSARDEEDDEDLEDEDEFDEEDDEDIGEELGEDDEDESDDEEDDDLGDEFNDEYVDDETEDDEDEDK